jgi:phenylalanyl-tRNA synthetase beta chain
MEWLNEYVNARDVEPREFARAMTLSGTKAENIAYLGEGIERVVTGRINSLAKHPDADRLQVAQVDVGEAEGGEIQIITGAANIKAGDVVPIALDKSRLPGGVRIKATKMRGLESRGMMCSIQELNLSKYDWPNAAEDGIFVLGEDVGPGVDIREALGLDDTAIDFEITYNRADCLGIIGIAREASVALDKPLALPEAFARDGYGGAAGGAAAAQGGTAAVRGGTAAPRPADMDGASDMAGAANASGVPAASGAPAVASMPADAGASAAPSCPPGSSLSVEIREPELCMRYTARIVTDAVIRDSPEWMRRRLRNAGVRPINNIVDITNYVMLEMGQPMHAFDKRFVGGGKIVVRRAGEGEAIKTLDGGDRELDPSVLVIADRDKPIAVAGVMGGANSEILSDTRDIVFESACFDGVSVRQTARKLGMRTESSSRYEKGLDPEMTLVAADRAIDLVELLGAGKAVKGRIDVYPQKLPRARVAFSPERINALLGTDIGKSYMEGVLRRLGFEFDGAEGRSYAIAPTFRRDVSQEADLAEEVARFYGYNNIRPTLSSGSQTTIGVRTYEQKLRQIVLDTAVSCGHSEIYTISFQSPKAYDRLGLPADSPLRDAVRIGNPSGEDVSLMRTTTLPDMFKAISENANRRTPSVRLFELSHTYHPRAAGAAGSAADSAEGIAVGSVASAIVSASPNASGAGGAGGAGDTDDAGVAASPAAAVAHGGPQGAFSDSALPEQRGVLTLGAYGDGNDFYSMKGLIEDIFSALGVRRHKIRPCADMPFFHPGRAAYVDVAGTEAGYFGEVHPMIGKEFELPERTYAGVISLKSLFAAANLEKENKKLPKVPPVPRDLAFVADKGVTYAEMADVMRKAAGDVLESVGVFDVYTGEQVPEGKKSVAFSLLFRSEGRTLVDDEVNAHVQAIIAALAKKVGASLRQ